MVREARLGKGYMPPTIVAFNAERRFPETWGREGNKNQVRAMIADIEAADATTAPEEKHLDAMDHDEVLARIAELEARRGKTPK
jgi:transposase